MFRYLVLATLACIVGGCAQAEPAAAPEKTTPVTALEAQPPLPVQDAQVTLSIQDGAGKPKRDLVVSLFYPHSRLANINAKSGLMLDLHNWGGKDTDGAPSPQALANTFDVVAIAVRYYQSSDVGNEPEPYDFGYLQAWDALRALHYVFTGLQAAKIPFDTARIYGTGGSGGGNVIQMANKFAPNTFACIVDLSGMPSLSNDIAYNIPGGSALNARYSKDPNSPAYLSKGMQEIRDLGNPAHLAAMAKAGNKCVIIKIHGKDDGYCLYDDANRVVTAMKDAGLTVEPHFFGKEDVDGKLVLNSGHSVGDRTALLMNFASDYLKPDSPKVARLQGPNNFEKRGKVTYLTTGIRFIVDYSSGYPEFKTEAVPIIKPKPTEESLFGAYVPVWAPRYPEGYSEGEGAAGTYFTTATAGKVLGLRFYKLAGSGHTMWLYNNATTPPTLLATLKFKPEEETASGWQEKRLPQPVAITPGVEYAVWRSSPDKEKHGWTNSGKAARGDNEKNLKGGGDYKATVAGDAITPLAGGYPNDIVDADVIFLANE